MANAAPEESYPALYYSADASSISSQRVHLRLLKWQLILFVLASVSGATEPLVNGIFHFESSFVTAILLAVGLLLMWIMKAQQNERAWFDARAVAESVKTAAWRYMMMAPPYEDKLVGAVEAQFVDDLHEILTAQAWVAQRLAPREGQQITALMRRTRTQSLEERQRIYLRDRLHDQRTWYTDKSNFNRRMASRWFWGIVAIQIVALALAILRVGRALPFPSVSLLMTIGAALTAWTQVRRYEELTQAYALASQELGSLESLGARASPDAFVQFVAQVEETISREHTMWCARRNVRLEAAPRH